MRIQVSRITLRNSITGDESTVTLSKEQEANEAHYKDKETGAELEVIEKMPLLEWLANSYKKFGCQLEFVTNKSQVGADGLPRPFSAFYFCLPDDCFLLIVVASLLISCGMSF